jgi:uncharacterized membrane protein
MTDDLFAQLERQLGRILFAGIMSAAIGLAVGLILSLAGGHAAAANAVMTVGLVVLMLTPVARVVASLVVYVRMRDWFFVATTITVFVVLLVAWLMKGTS